MPTRDLSNLKEKVRQLPFTPGVYLMKDRFGSVIYVGKAKSLKKRVSTYFQPSRKTKIEQPKVAAMLDLIYDFDIVEVKSETEALLLEGKLIKQYKPKYNTDFTDDKRFLLVRVDPQQQVPAFRLVRFRKDDEALYFGPFAHAGLLRKTLGEMRRKFGIALGDARPTVLETGEVQLYDDARAEIYGQPNVMPLEEYHGRVAQACEFLEGKSREWLAELKDEMVKAAQDRAYEKAADLRDIVFALERTLTRTRKFVREPLSMRNAHAGEAVLSLQEDLAMREPPKRIECFDISHVSGTFCVASMVSFWEGRPDKGNYRRFKIKTFIGNDDFRAMEEVVARRYRRLYDEQRDFPDLVVIDGGKGQVTAALRAFLEEGLEPPELIGLAKKQETIIFSDGRPPLNLPYHNEGLRLLQRVRDEAHRFANTFNAELRSKRIRETILDDFPGLGAVRKQALLDHFRTFEAIRKASAEELQKAPGIGPKFARQLFEFLREGVGTGVQKP